MKTLKTFSTFLSTLPEAGSWEEDGGHPVGRKPLELLGRIFDALGFEATYFDQRDFYGWELEVKKDKLKFVCVIQPDPDRADDECSYLLQCKPEQGLLPFGRPHPSAWKDVLDEIYERFGTQTDIINFNPMTYEEFAAVEIA
ncbi:MAG: hypothetical protein CMK07_14535 [Ponticaulis sp.]|nr:hypothetical protein [Ponticaulis sp.]